MMKIMPWNKSSNDTNNDFHIFLLPFKTFKSHSSQHLFKIPEKFKLTE